MPTAYIQSLHETTGLALDTLEKYWAKAKAIAKKNGDAVGDRYWAYVTGIFKNMVGVSESATHENFPDWWKNMDREARKKYLKEHPKSRFAKRLHKLEQSKGRLRQKVKTKAARDRRRNDLEAAFTPIPTQPVPKPEPVPQPTAHEEVDDDFKDWVDPDEVEKDVPKSDEVANDEVDDAFKDEVDPDEVSKPEPDAEETPAEEPEYESPKGDVDEDEPGRPRKGQKDDEDERPHGYKEGGRKLERSMKGVASRAWKSVRQHTIGSLRHHKQGFSAIGKFLGGGKLSEVEWHRAKRTAGLTAKLVLAALVGFSLFTPLGGYVQELGAHFLNLQRGSSESKDMVSESGNTEEFAGKFADSMHEWLLEQDVPALLKQLEGMKK